MNRIERYLASVVVSHALLVLFVLTLIMGFFEFISQLGRLSDSYSLGSIVFFTLLRLPMYAYELFSVALLIGVLMGLSRLASQSELTVIRVSGWSVGRILYAILKVTVILLLLMAIIGEVLAPKTEAYAKKFRGEILQKSISVGNQNGLWLKEPNRYIHVERVISTEELQNITVYEKQDGDLTQRISAPNAKYLNGKWTLFNGLEQNLTFKSYAVDANSGTAFDNVALLDWQSKTFEHQVFSFPLDPDVIESLNIDSRFMNIMDLHLYIDFLKENELESVSYELDFWRKLANPLVAIGMVAIVFPLIFGLQRQINTGQRVFIGVLIGMGFHLFNQIFGNVSIIYGFPPVVGAFLPAMLMLMAAYLWIKKL